MKPSDIQFAWLIVLDSHRRAEKDGYPSKYTPDIHSITDRLLVWGLCRSVEGRVYMTNKGRTMLAAWALTQ